MTDRDMLEMIRQIVAPEHDGCCGCAYDDRDEWEMPCCKCSHGCRDYWRPAAREGGGEK